MKEICPRCGGRVKVAGNGNLIPRDALVCLKTLAEAHPLRMGRILELIELLPPRGVEDLLRMVEDILGR